LASRQNTCAFATGTSLADHQANERRPLAGVKVKRQTRSKGKQSMPPSWDLSLIPWTGQLGGAYLSTSARERLKPSGGAVQRVARLLPPPHGPLRLWIVPILQAPLSFGNGIPHCQCSKAKDAKDRNASHSPALQPRVRNCGN